MNNQSLMGLSKMSLQPQSSSPPNSTKPFHIEADSSYFTTRAILSQISPEDGKWHLVAFFSKSLSPVKHNYEIHNKDMLAIIWPLQEW
jgi:hypothetical protein